MVFSWMHMTISIYYDLGLVRHAYTQDDPVNPLIPSPLGERARVRVL